MMMIGTPNTNSGDDQHQSFQFVALGFDTEDNNNASDGGEVILHRNDISSYLSLNDAQSILSAASSISHSRSSGNAAEAIGEDLNNTINSYSSSLMQSIFPPPSPIGHEDESQSLDYHFYHSLSRSRMMDGASAASLGQQQQQQYGALASQVGAPSNSSSAAAGLNMNQLCNTRNHNSMEDEEDWFVGGQHSINSVGGLSLPLHHQTEASPLEDEFYDENEHEHQLLAQQHQQLMQKHQQQQQQIEAEDVEGGSPWTPAGQPTGEQSDEKQHQILQTSNQHTISKQDRTTPNNNNNNPHQHQHHPTQFILFNKQRRKLTRYQKKQSLQNKLAAAVFAHPRPLREYCLDAYATALSLSMERQQHQLEQLHLQQQQNQNSSASGSRQQLIKSSPLDGSGGLFHCRHPSFASQRYNNNNILLQEISSKAQKVDGQFHPRELLQAIETIIHHNIPLSVVLDLTESTCELSLSTLIATSHLTSITTQKTCSLLCHTAQLTTSTLSKMNPFRAIQFVVNAQKSAMGKTGDVLVSGIQSVATGVGSVSNAALNRLSKSGLALAGGVVAEKNHRSGCVIVDNNNNNTLGSSRGMMMNHGGVGRGGMRGKGDTPATDALESKLFHRLQKMESVSKLVAYSERAGEEAFSRHAKKRAQRMMHYNVSFRPFTATIQPGNSPKSNKRRSRSKIKHNVSFELDDGENGNLRGGGDGNHSHSAEGGDEDDDSVSSESLNSSGSVFMRTPTSFPPTPTSRMYYFERGSQFTENVVFLARDQLRVERGVVNHNEQTRAMSKALISSTKLAVFDAANLGNGIALSCGQHIATKVGNALYCSTRSMIPVMRNSYVYFEISVSPSTTSAATAQSSSGLIPTAQVDATTLLIGLSTLEMPLDTLVGACRGSLGLCSTGQLLHSGQWFSLSNPEESSFGSNSTVGCLVYLDDTSAYNDSDGQNVIVDATFNINGRIVPSTLISGSDNSNHDSSFRSAGTSGDGCEPTLSFSVPKTHELFPTVTLHSSGTSVMCRFSSEDLLANTRTEIGALSGVNVYAVDGSVILDESEEDDFIGSSSQGSGVALCSL